MPLYCPPLCIYAQAGPCEVKECEAATIRPKYPNLLLLCLTFVIGGRWLFIVFIGKMRSTRKTIAPMGFWKFHPYRYRRHKFTLPKSEVYDPVTWVGLASQRGLWLTTSRCWAHHALRAIGQYIYPWPGLRCAGNLYRDTFPPRLMVWQSSVPPTGDANYGCSIFMRL